MKLWLLHPMAVHFPVALLVTGFAFHARSLAKGDGPPGGGGGEWVGPAARWLLWLGTLAAWSALGLGLLAEKTAPHVPSAWEAFADHEAAAYWTCGLFSALSLVAFEFRRRGEAAPAWGAKALTAFWLVALAALVRTAALGGDLVYEHNMGTRASAQ